MSNIISLHNQPLTSKAEVTEADISNAKQPTVHEPRWYRRRVRLADERFHQIYAEFTEDMAASKTPGTSVDRDAVKREYGHQWAQYASSELKGPEPIPLKVDAMYEAIENAYRLSDDKLRLERLFNTPMHELTVADMESAGWAMVVQQEGRTVYLSTQAYITVHASGLVQVSPRPMATSTQEWFWNLPRNPMWEFPNYTIAEFAKLVVGLRLQQPVLPDPATLAAAVKAFSEADPKEDPIA